MRYPLTLLFFTLFCTCGRAQNTFPVLTESQRIAHLERRADSTTWNRKMLTQDIRFAAPQRSAGTTHEQGGDLRGETTGIGVVPVP